MKATKQQRLSRTRAFSRAGGEELRDALQQQFKIKTTEALTIARRLNEMDEAARAAANLNANKPENTGE